MFAERCACAALLWTIYLSLACLTIYYCLALDRGSIRTHNNISGEIRNYWIYSFMFEVKIFIEWKTENVLCVWLVQGFVFFDDISSPSIVVLKDRQKTSSNKNCLLSKQKFMNKHNKLSLNLTSFEPFVKFVHQLSSSVIACLYLISHCSEICLI